MFCVLSLELRDFLFVLLFFFFQQKTAYELRISDWSSDVCSSDLFRRAALPAARRAAYEPAHPPAGRRRTEDAQEAPVRYHGMPVPGIDRRAAALRSADRGVSGEGRCGLAGRRDRRLPLSRDADRKSAV